MAILFLIITVMEKKEYYVQPKIADRIVELSQEHNLPVNIIVGVLVDGMKPVTFEYELIDYNLVAWLVNKGTQFYTQLPAEEIVNDYD